MDYIISRYINGITLNPLEHVLEDDDTLMYFSSIAEAKNFIIDSGFKEEDIGYSVFIGTEKKPDMVTYGSKKYKEQIL